MKSDQCKVQSDEERCWLVSGACESMQPLRLPTLHFALITSHFSLRPTGTKAPLTLALSPEAGGEGTRRGATS